MGRDGIVLVVMSKRIQELNICIIVSATYLRIQDSSLSQTIVMLPNQPILRTGEKRLTSPRPYILL